MYGPFGTFRVIAGQVHTLTGEAAVRRGDRPEALQDFLSGVETRLKSIGRSGHLSGILCGEDGANRTVAEFDAAGPSEETAARICYSSEQVPLRLCTAARNLSGAHAHVRDRFIPREWRHSCDGLDESRASGAMDIR